MASDDHLSRPRDGEGFDADPDASSPYWKLDEPLRRTLKRSFVDRMRRVPGAERNLDVAWYAAGNDPRTTWEALECVGPLGVNLFVRVYERIRDIDRAGRLWRHVRYICNHWFGGSGGFKVAWEDPDAAREYLDALLSGDRGRRVARDLLLGAIEHQLDGTALQVIRRHRIMPWDLLSVRPPPDCDTWREVHRLKEEALHFCIGKHPSRPIQLDDIHIDWSSPVRGIDPATSRCAYDLGYTGVTHWLQAMRGLNKPVDPFGEMERLVESGNGLAQRLADHPVMNEWEVHVQRWREIRWLLAVQGKQGYDESLRWCHEARELSGRMRALASVSARRGP